MKPLPTEQTNSNLNHRRPFILQTHLYWHISFYIIQVGILWWAGTFWTILKDGILATMMAFGSGPTAWLVVFGEYSSDSYVTRVSHLIPFHSVTGLSIWSIASQHVKITTNHLSQHYLTDLRNSTYPSKCAEDAEMVQKLWEWSEVRIDEVNV